MGDSADRIWSLGLPPSQKVSVRVKHEFSVEVEDAKRQFIMSAHGQKMHLFDDVSIFSPESVDADHYCYTCQRRHGLPESIDILASGPSCKNLSLMFQQRDAYQQCFFPDSRSFTVLCTAQHAVPYFLLKLFNLYVYS